MFVLKFSNAVFKLIQTTKKKMFLLVFLAIEIKNEEYNSPYEIKEGGTYELENCLFYGLQNSAIFFNYEGDNTYITCLQRSYIC